MFVSACYFYRYFVPTGRLKKDTVILKGWRGMAGIGRLFGLFECACFIIVRPFRLAYERGMIIQAFVPHWGSAAGGPCGQMWYPGEKWTDYTRLYRRAVE